MFFSWCAFSLQEIDLDKPNNFIFSFVQPEPTQEYPGENDTTIVCEYEMKEPDNFEMTGEAPDPTVRKDAFKNQRVTENWFDGLKITCLSGLQFHLGELRNEVIYNNKYRMNRNERTE